ALTPPPRPLPGAAPRRPAGAGAWPLLAGLLAAALLGSLPAAGFFFLQAGALSRQLTEAEQPRAAALQPQDRSARATAAGLRHHPFDAQQKAQDTATTVQTLEKRLADTEQQLAEREQKAKEAAARAAELQQRLDQASRQAREA